MKKIYSLVLMAVILLIGTNVWAGSVSTWDDLKTALQAGGNVTLSADINVTATNVATWRGIWIGSESVDGTAPKAVLDLNGHDIIINSGNYQNKNGVTQEQALNPFAITKGSLTIKSDSPAKIQVVKGQSIISKSTNVFSVFGADDANKVDPKGNNPFTYLEIGKNVTVETQNGTVVAIDALKAGHAAVGSNTNYTTYPTGEKSGYAYGARIEIKGSLISQGAESTTKSTDKKTGLTSYQNKCYGIKVNGLVASPAAENKMYAPYVHIHPSAVLQSDNRSGFIGNVAIMAGSAAVYASGFAQWLIEGNCSGATGVYIGSGILVINDAQVKSAADEYDAAGAGGHANGSGSAIVINSRSNYPGEVAVTVTGDTKAEATSGYAFEEIVNTTNNNSKVENITIQGGTFEGGAQGALVVTQATATEATVNVTGGNVEGTGNIGTDNLATYLNNQGGTHTTLIEDGGKTILVISDGDAPTGMPDFVSNADLSVKWTGASKDIEGTFALKELEINEATAQVLTVKQNATFKVERVILGANAKIIVEPGGKFIVTGAQGIVAPSADNILLQAEEGNPAIFVFNPAVTSNRHPKATVEFVSRSFTVNSSNYAFQRFGIPTTGTITDITTKYNNADVPTYFMSFNYVADDWASIGYINAPGKTQLDTAKLSNPFEYYQMQHNTPSMGTVVTFKGELVGNEIPAISARAEFWNGYANSCTGNMSIKELLSELPAGAKSVYLNNVQAHQKVWESYTLLNSNGKMIQPMQPFLVRNTNSVVANIALDYGDAVYYPTTGETKPNAAPARRSEIDNITMANIIVNGENTYDRVIVAEDAEFSADFEDGYDAVKFMNSGINMYVSANEKMSIFATDNLENTYVGFQANNGGTYTIEFANVQGEELILIDLETGARVAMVEGNTYEFTANEANDYRFQITKISKVATDIENTEAVKNVKGIYTITGQYVGEMNVWNTLPAGVYVVNGEKRVK